MKHWFNYEGVDAKGQEVTGTVEAVHVNDADAAIRERGVQPVRIFEYDKVRVIERSLACFALGWVSLIPVLGIVAAVRGIVLYQRVRLEAGENWNPARRYLICGFVMTWLGSLVSIISSGLLLMLLLKMVEE